MRRFALLALVILCVLSRPAAAQEAAAGPDAMTLVIFPVEGDAKASELAAIEEELNDVVVNLLKRDGWTILLGRTSLPQAGSHGEEARDLASGLNAGKYLQCAVRSVDGEFIGSLRLFDTGTGALIGNERVRGKSSGELIKNLEGRTTSLLQGAGLVIPKEPPPPAPAPAPVATKPAAKKGGIAAVLPLNVSGAAIDDQTKRALDETIQSFLAKTLSDYGYSVLDSDTTLRYLDENGINAEKVCTANCALTAAKELKATLYLSGSVSKSEGEFVALIRIYTTATNGRVLNAVTLEGASVREIRKAFQAQVGDFVAKGLAKLE